MTSAVAAVRHHQVAIQEEAPHTVCVDEDPLGTVRPEDRLAYYDVGAVSGAGLEVDVQTADAVDVVDAAVGHEHEREVSA